MKPLPAILFILSIACYTTAGLLGDWTGWLGDGFVVALIIVLAPERKERKERE